MDLAARMDMKRFETAVQVIDLHAAGEPCRVATGGFPEPQGATMIEKRRWMEERCDDVRRALMLEPRGHGNMFGAFLCRPSNPQAQVASCSWTRAATSTCAVTAPWRWRRRRSKRGWWRCARGTTRWCSTRPPGSCAPRCA